MKNRCKICGCENIKIEYEGQIRDGGLGRYTINNVKMYRCNNCNVIWHNAIKDLDNYYMSEEYRMSLEGTIDEVEFYNMHDKESLDKFRYTGMIFRDKIVADIGCGCGAFLDLISGVSKKTIAIEPTLKFRDILLKKGYDTYGYAKEAIKEYKNKVDIAVSFDVIEHVESPYNFMTDIYNLLNQNGLAIIGTPTETPIMRELLGECYEKKVLFSTQHIWILGKDNLERVALKTGFKKENIEIKYFQRYGLDNVFSWLNSKNPVSNISYGMISKTIDLCWKSTLEEREISDYIVLYLRKK